MAIDQFNLLGIRDKLLRIVFNRGSACLLLSMFGILWLLAELQLQRNPKVFTIPVSQCTLELHDGLVSGTLDQTPAQFQRRWDGLPPTVYLTDSSQTHILAPPVLTEKTFNNSSRAVFWNPTGTCQFILPEEMAHDLANNDLLVLEELPPRWRFYLAALFSFLLFVAGIYFRFRSQLTFIPASGRSEFIRERTICFGFFGLAAVGSLAFYPGVPVTPVASDVPNLNAMAAATDNPNTFVNDEVFSDPRNFSWYTPFYIRLVQTVGRLGFHYNTSRFFLSLIIISAGLFGYYRLFRLCSGSWLVGFFSSLALWYMEREYPAVEFWSPTVIQPRALFSAFLPWVLLLAVRYARTPNKWWIPAACGAFSVYLHPVSAPALLGALLMALPFGKNPFRLDNWKWAIAAGIVAIIILAPYAWIYSTRYVDQNESVDISHTQIVRLSQEHHGAEYHNMDVFLQFLGSYLAGSIQYVVAGLTLCLVTYQVKRRASVRFLWGAVTGFCIVTFLVPIVDWKISELLGRMPYQLDLIRGVRYLDVICLSIILLGIRVLSGNISKLQIFRQSGRLLLRRVSVYIAIVFLIFCYVPQDILGITRLSRLRYLNLSLLVSGPHGAVADRLELLSAISLARKPSELVYGPHYLAQGKIPLSVTRYGLNFLAYANLQKFVEGCHRLSRVDELKNKLIDSATAKQISEIMHADWLVLNRSQVSESLLDSSAVFLKNQRFVLLESAFIDQIEKSSLAESPTTPRPIDVLAGEDEPPNSRR